MVKNEVIVSKDLVSTCTSLHDTASVPRFVVCDIKLLMIVAQLQVSMTVDDVARRNIVDPSIHKECSDESLKIVMEICIRCLSKEPSDRPSVDDVLWNLQFAAQVRESSRTG